MAIRREQCIAMGVSPHDDVIAVPGLERGPRAVRCRRGRAARLRQGTRREADCGRGWQDRTEGSQGSNAPAVRPRDRWRLHARGHAKGTEPSDERRLSGKGRPPLTVAKRLLDVSPGRRCDRNGDDDQCECFAEGDWTTDIVLGESEDRPMPQIERIGYEPNEYERLKAKQVDRPPCRVAVPCG